MTVTERTARAAADSDVVVDADGLVAAFNDAAVLSPLDVLAATTIGRLYNEDDPRVLLAAALAVRGTRYGHICVRLDAQRTAVVVEGRDPEVVDELPWPDPDEWTAAVSASALVGDADAETPLILIEDRLYLQRYHEYEARFAGGIVSRVRLPKKLVRRETLDLLASRLGPREDGSENLQHAAAVVALERHLAVVAGGPGTGKTHTVGVLVSVLAETADTDFPLVALAAPTGKAANRLGDAVSAMAAEIQDPAARERVDGIEALTIHRLLGSRPGRGRFKHDRRNRLPHDLVIVDEASMVSLPLAAKLLSAMRDDATLVLVGDPAQLESIEAGTVLGDIVGHRTGPEAVESTGIGDQIVVLDLSHRFDSGGPIARFTDAVRRGDADAAIGHLSAGNDEVRWVEDRTDAAFRGTTDRILDQRVRLVELAREPGKEREALLALAELAVLSGHRRGPNSVAEWRDEIEGWLDERFPTLRHGGEWYPGRPVMITKNDYTLRLFNGDIGVATTTGDGMQVVFGGRELRHVPRSQLGEHETVHAMTIHKSQGSQFKEVVVALPTEESRLLTRELLYTAVTRASDRVTVIGTEAVIRRAIDRSVQRASGLGVRLWG